MEASEIFKSLYSHAVDLLNQRFPDQMQEGAAAIYCETGKILTSTAIEVLNDSVALCHEVGAICEAYKLNEKIIATLCISRDIQGAIHILTPCGVCQERLMYWGPQVMAAVPHSQDSTQWEIKTLELIQPYYWKNPFKIT